MMRSNTCPKCQGTMAEGFVPYDKHGMRAVSGWVEGAPLKSIWTGVKQPAKPIEISTLRCRRCGFLESYARD